MGAAIASTAIIATDMATAMDVARRLLRVIDPSSGQLDEASRQSRNNALPGWSDGLVLDQVAQQRQPLRGKEKRRGW